MRLSLAATCAALFLILPTAAVGYLVYENPYNFIVQYCPTKLNSWRDLLTAWCWNYGDLIGLLVGFSIVLSPLSIGLIFTSVQLISSRR